MNRFLLFLCVSLLLAACGRDQTTPANDGKSEELTQDTPAVLQTDPNPKIVKEESARAKAAIAVFASALKAELQNAMQQGGPINAIGVCNTTAMQ
jgi:hypothetical protein